MKRSPKAPLAAAAASPSPSRVDAARVAAGGRKQDFSGLLDVLVDGAASDSVALGQLMNIAGRRTFGPVILLLGFIAISPLTVVPGASWLVAAATLLFSLQLLVGRRKPLLPPQLLRLSMPGGAVRATLNAARPAARWMDKVTRPRLVFLTEPPFVILTALACAAAALVTFPLGVIPFGPVLPGISIVLLGVGLTARDGLFLGASLLALAGAGVMSITVLQKWLGLLMERLG